MMLRFSEGSLLLGRPKAETSPLPGFQWDERVALWRAPAQLYRETILFCHKEQIVMDDQARSYGACALPLREKILPRRHQAEALAAWEEAGRMGVVSLPTGAGKTILAVLAIAKVGRPTLVVVPTIDLMHQWQTVLAKFFAGPIGCVGGGLKDWQPLTVATYNSAALTLEREGHRFGFLICDECHHLPAPHFRHIGLCSLAPFRLGLSATLERTDGGEETIYELLGKRVYSGAIGEMIDTVLAPYDVVTVEIPLTSEEFQTYQTSRGIYTQFIRQHRIDMRGAEGWQHFLRKACVLPGGREAIKAHRLQKRLAQGASGKLREVWHLVQKHAHDRILIFTNDNAFAYRIGRDLILPVLTHQTKAVERRDMLEAFKTGKLGVIVTSKVLNEGVDVPEANVGIIVSGSAGVREHVQRLGRLLRRQPGKRAVLYELISKDTSENYVKDRRRQHDAYQGSSEIQNT